MRRCLDGHLPSERANIRHILRPKSMRIFAPLRTKSRSRIPFRAPLGRMDDSIARTNTGNTPGDAPAIARDWTMWREWRRRPPPAWGPGRDSGFALTSTPRVKSCRRRTRGRASSERAHALLVAPVKGSHSLPRQDSAWDDSAVSVRVRPAYAGDLEGETKPGRKRLQTLARIGKKPLSVGPVDQNPRDAPFRDQWISLDSRSASRIALLVKPGARTRSRIAFSRRATRSIAFGSLRTASAGITTAPCTSA